MATVCPSEVLTPAKGCCCYAACLLLATSFRSKTLVPNPSKQRPYTVCIYIFICCRSQNRKPQQRPLPINQPTFCTVLRPTRMLATDQPKITTESNQINPSNHQSIQPTSQLHSTRNCSVFKEAMTTGGSCCFQRSHDNGGERGGTGATQEDRLEIQYISLLHRTRSSKRIKLLIDLLQLLQTRFFLWGGGSFLALK